MSTFYTTDYIEQHRAELQSQFTTGAIRMQTIIAHGVIAAELAARGKRNITRALINDEVLRRRIEAAQADLAAPPRRPGDPRPFTDDAERDRDLNRRIREGLEFLARPRHQPGKGVDLSAALWLRGDKQQRETRDRERWRVSVHESAHAVTVNALRPGGVTTVCVAPDGRSGECRFSGTLSDLDDAIVSAAGREAEFIFGCSPNTRLQDHDATCDGPKFLQSLAEHHGAEVGDLDPLATSATEAARWYIESNTRAIVGVAKLLFDFGEVGGEDVRAVAEFHDGKYDGMLRDRGIDRQ